MASNEHIGGVRGLGAMLGIELVEDRASKAPAATIASRTVELARERGLLRRAPASTRTSCASSCRSSPATDDDIREGLEILASSLRDAAA